MTKQPHVLIVEDDKFLLDMYVLKFNERVFTVSTAFSGPEALDKLGKEKINPDLILLDLVMPGMGGFEVLEKIKKEKLAPNATIVILSNLGQKEDVDKGVALGADGYIVKASATPTEVVNRVSKILEDKGS
ncbi:MAG: hypothetical protein A2749_01180 [Parcubacteria group bacterium RIFCSPHIGHO2_01_FULL_45_26]|nr:MAG: hypothetical protein A2749_01180 [Parcubacteria group bacterium RIFCSPHIGHO2_01_FULL_45_26]